MSKHNQTKFVKKRHQTIVKVAKRIVAPFFRTKAKFHLKPFDLTPYGPSLIISNHVHPFDPIFITDTFDQQIYYIASEIIFSNGLISRLLEYAFAPIPKTKSQTDINAIKQMITIAKEGGSVGVFVEGNSSFNGETYPFADSIGKLVLMLKLPLVIFNFKGGYLTKPRWSRYPKKGRYEGSVRQVIPYEDYRYMSAEQIGEMVREKIDINAYRDHLDVDYKGKRRAEGLQRLLFTCPECHGVNTVFTKGHYYHCKQCGIKALYDERGYLELPHLGRQDLVTLDKQNLIEYEKFILANPSFNLTYDARMIHIFKRNRIHQGRVTITLSQEGLSVIKQKNGQITQFTLDTIDAVAIQQQQLLLFYIEGQPTIGMRLNTIDSPYQMMKTFELFKKKAKELQL